MGFTLGTKFNEGTDWEFTVSAETLAEVVTGGGITEADIADYCYTAFIDKRVASLVPESTRNSNDGLYPWAQEYCPVYNTNQGQHPSELKMNIDVLNDNKVECYERNILTYYGTIGGKTGHFLIMDMHDIKKWIIDCDASGAFSSAAVTSTAGFNGINDTIYLYDTNNVPQINPLNGPPGTTGGLYPCNVVTIDSTLWIGFFTPIAHSKNLLFNEKLSHAAWEFDYAAGDTFNVNSTGYVYQGDALTLQGWCEFTDLEFPTSTGTTTSFTTYIDADGFNIIRIIGQYGNAGNPFITNAEMGNMFKTLKALHTVESWAGFLFYDNGVTYKPIIEGGIITGFTSDMDIPSEWDDMTNVTGNNISPAPPTPPGPAGDEDNTDPIATTGAPFSSGIAHYYITTAGSLVLQHISEALGAWDLKNTGKDLFKNLISCKLIKPPTAVPSTSGVFTIYGEKPQYNGADITISEVTGNPDQSFGPYTIPRKFNDFRDYAPYSKAEIFLPYCGWCGLPSHVIGRSVTVKYFTDIIAATCKAIVFCGNNIVAEAAGVIGCDIPMAADNVGMKMAGATTGLLAIVSGGVQTGAGAFNMMTGNIGKGAAGVLSGLSKVASGYTQSAMSLNENNTEISGKNGDGCNIAGTTNIIIKITRPKTGGTSAPSYVPAGFAHSTGFLAGKEVTVGSVSGLLIADNVDTSGIGGATDAERAEIKRVLETGLIVNSAPTPPEP